MRRRFHAVALLQVLLASKQVLIFAVLVKKTGCATPIALLLTNASPRAPGLKLKGCTTVGIHIYIYDI
jgi:hypothetical protein